MYIIETQRTRIRKYTLDDASFFRTLTKSPKWIKFIGDKNLHTLEDAQNFIQARFLKNYEALGFGYYVIETKEGKIPVGTCGLVDREGLDFIDIGYALLPEYEGNGYAFEATKALYAYAMNHLKLETILAITLPENKGSVRLLKKLGMSFQKMVRIPGDPKDLMLFSS